MPSVHASRYYTMQSPDDPSVVYRVLRPTIAPSVFRPHAADHVPVREDHPELRELCFSPLFDRARPSFWRSIAIHAVAKMLVRLVNPGPVASDLDKHLQERSGRDMGRVGYRPHRLLIDGQLLEILDDGHSITLRLRRGSKARHASDAESGSAA